MKRGEKALDYKNGGIIQPGKIIGMSDRKKTGWAQLLAGLIIAAPLAFWIAISLELFLTKLPAPNFSGPIADHVQLSRPDTFRLAVLGDCRGNTGPVETILLDARERADAALIMGDLVDRGSRILFRYLWREIHERVPGLPIFFGIGNHDLIAGKSGDLFRSYFGPDHFWQRFGRNLFLMINNVERDRWKGEVDWLTQALKEQWQAGDHVYLFMHKPTYDEGSEPGMSAAQSEKLYQVLSRYPNVTILASHDHTYREYSFNGIPVYVTGEAGAPQHRSPPSYGYILMECGRENCRLTHRVLGYIPPRDYLERRAFTDLYWAWPLLSLLAAVGMLIVSRVRKKSTPADKA